MATVNIAGEDRRLVDPIEISKFLAPFGVTYEHWDVEGRLAANASDEQILAEYRAEIERLKQSGGYVTADVINVSPDTPGLDQMMAKFDKEHTHSEDEVRFTVAGQGVFWIHPDQGPVFSIEVTSGDLIRVPAGAKHWFHLCDDRHIRCIRLFQDPSGWTPEYMAGGIHTQHAPLCWGPSYLPQADDLKPAVKL